MSQEKTEKATPRKREQAKKKGQVAKGPELPTAFGFLAGLLTLSAVGGDIFTEIGHFIERIAEKASHSEEMRELDLHLLLTDAITTLALVALPIIFAVLVAAAAGNIAQTGFSITPEALMPNAGKFNPVSNLKRVFGLDGLVNLAKSSVKLVLFASVAYGVLAPMLVAAPTFVNAPVGSIGIRLSETIYSLAIRYGLIMFVLAGADYGYAKYKFEKSLKMSKQEVRDEFREQEGDPMIKGQRRRAARAMAQKRAISNVPEATVVVTNPTHFAVALRYERDTDIAPVVVAKGADFVAKKIREIAAENDVPLFENPPLARALYRAVEPDQIVPVEFFGAVAEVLAYVYRQNEKAESAFGPGNGH
ncbi:MAG: flagellar biosynthesis protein FlhB [Pyrinomonadaceae bacterium]